MGRAKGVNPKAAAGNEKKAANEAVKAAKSAAEREKSEDQDWSQGTNNRRASKMEGEAAKADEAARKRREKDALLAEEEAALGSGGKAKKTPTLSTKKNKKKGDLAFLEDALVSSADKKLKAKKAAERAKQEKIAQEQAKKKAEEKPMDPLMANTEQMIAGTMDDLVGRKANKALEAENSATGIDASLASLNVSVPGGGAAPLSAKALHKAFEERMLPEMKQDYPNMKLSQYKDKIFQLWKKSPENPANHVM
jgi:hypothetical protein